MRAELDFVGAVGFWFSAFVFDGNNGAIQMKLYDIALSRETEIFGADGEGTGGADAMARLGGGIVDSLVKNPAFGGVSVLQPFAIHVDECELAFTEKEVL